MRHSLLALSIACSVAAYGDTPTVKPSAGCVLVQRPGYASVISLSTNYIEATSPPNTPADNFFIQLKAPQDPHELGIHFLVITETEEKSQATSACKPIAVGRQMCVLHRKELSSGGFKLSVHANIGAIDIMVLKAIEEQWLNASQCAHN
ncbi:MAG: hypothetical protein EG825_08925 [Rhodocyclaceae bacterium]|nr:hypothetical protein [Rhodocyclaceae bacterium]